MAYRDKECVHCGCTFSPTTGSQKQCTQCKELLGKSQASARTMKYLIKTGAVKCPGVGSGNNQPEYKDHPRYKNGRSFFQKHSQLIRKNTRYCERCGKDLKDATRGNWAVHHKDHDPNHNELSNYELLCKVCHVNEHKDETREARWGNM